MRTRSFASLRMTVDEDEMLSEAKDDTVKQLRGMRITADLSAFGEEDDGHIHSSMCIITPVRKK